MYHHQQTDTSEITDTSDRFTHVLYDCYRTKPPAGYTGWVGLTEYHMRHTHTHVGGIVCLSMAVVG